MDGAVIHLWVPGTPSRHERDKDLRHAYSEGVRVAMQGTTLAKRVYRVEFTVYGHWFKPDGTPLARDADSVITVLLDAIAEHGGLGARGRGDQWLNRDYSVKVIEAPMEAVDVRLY